MSCASLLGIDSLAFFSGIMVSGGAGNDGVFLAFPFCLSLDTFVDATSFILVLKDFAVATEESVCAAQMGGNSDCCNINGDILYVSGEKWLD